MQNGAGSAVTHGGGANVAIATPGVVQQGVQQSQNGPPTGATSTTQQSQNGASVPGNTQAVIHGGGANVVTANRLATGEKKALTQGKAALSQNAAATSSVPVQQQGKAGRV